MRILTVFLLVLVALSGAVNAQEGYPPECRFVTMHKPAPDVAYQPGVDVHGKSVVPADINAAPSSMGKESVIVPLTVDLAKRMRNQNIAGLNLEGTLGFLEIKPDGKVLYNGQDLTDDMSALCEKKPAETVAPADGQKAPDAVEYAPETTKE